MNELINIYLVRNCFKNNIFNRNTPMVKLLFAFLIVSPFGVFSQGNAGNSEFKSIEFNSSTQIVEKSLPPLLEVSDVKFSDANQNNRSI